MKSNLGGRTCTALIATLLMVSFARADSSANVGNFALGDGLDTVSVVVNGAPVASGLVFGSLIEGIAVPSGAATLSLQDDRGGLIAEREVEFLTGLSYTILAVGNGEDRPYQLRVTREHMRPLDPAVASIYWYNAAVHPSNTLWATRSCVSDAPGQTGSGAQTLIYASEGRTVSFTTASSCNVEVRIPEGLATPPHGGTLLFQSQLQHRMGRLQRIVLSGDGATKPYELMVFESATQARPLIDVDARMDGLWFDPSDNGSGVALMVEPRAGGGFTVSGTLYGYGLDGEPLWVGISNEPGPGWTQFWPEMNLSLFESAGGNMVGTRQPARIRIGRAWLGFHSCNEASLHIVGSEDRIPRRLGYGPDQTEQLWRLLRLLPPGDCNAAGAPGLTKE